MISDPSGQRPPLPFVVHVLALSVLLAWLYNSTGGSVLLAMIFHAAVNTSARFVLPGFSDEHYLTA